jgi:TatA/E family protein of Tat protein translocase
MSPIASLALVSFGLMEMVLLFAVIMLLFGAKKIPQLAKGLGAGIRNFKGELNPPPPSDPDDQLKP